MPLGIEDIVLRVMRLEKLLRKLADKIQDLAGQVGQIRLRDPDRGNDRDREGEIVIVRPTETIGMASFTEAVTGPPYQEARLVPDTGQARVWYTYDITTGELRSRDTIRRWDPAPEPAGTFSDANARVTVDNINPSEEIPSTAKYAVCVRRGGRLVALVWECT